MKKLLALFAAGVLTGCAGIPTPPPVQAQAVQIRTVKVCDENMENCKLVEEEVQTFIPHRYGYPYYYGPPPVTFIWSMDTRPLCWKKNRQDCHR